MAQCQIKTKKILKRRKEALRIIAGYKSGTKCIQNLSGLHHVRMKPLNIVNFYTYPNPVKKNCILVEPTVFEMFKKSLVLKRNSF